jgi:hypothetical protein
VFAAGLPGLKYADSLPKGRSKKLQHGSHVEVKSVLFVPFPPMSNGLQVHFIAFRRPWHCRV